MVYAIGTDGLHFFLIKYMHVFSTPHHSREVPLLKMAKKKKKDDLPSFNDSIWKYINTLG